MLGIVFIYFIGKAFYTLAEENNKEQLWLWAILGVISYYIGGFLAGILLVIAVLLFDLNIDLENLNFGLELMLGLVGGIATCVGLYQFLKYRWSKIETGENDEILDIDFLDDNV